jgi:malate dehydrogenase (oxaloacetate-decarboxylating)
MHRGGKLETGLKSPLRTQDDLSMAYTPGVARVCRAIHTQPDAGFELTIRHNTVAVVSDGSAVLGLGNIGPRAALPVMEGKCMLFKTFAGVDAFPICLDTQDVGEIVRACAQLAPTFGGLNLEDISSPRCVEIEQQLIELLDIPVFHDDQHGTAVVVLAAMKNALKIVGKRMDSLRVTISGAGAAGAAVSKLLLSVGCRRIVVCDRAGAIGRGRAGDANPVKRWLAENTNPENFAGTLAESLAGADVFIGVSGPNLLTAADIRRMAARPVVFALANPDPEIDPAAAGPHAAIVATGRSDYPNQINNVLCFPGLFRGMFDARARRVTESMKLAAAEAIAAMIPEAQLRPERIVPGVFEPGVASAVARAVAQAAQRADR